MPPFASASRAVRYALIAAATILFLSASAWGQAAPSLIPYTVSIFAGGGPTATYAAGSLCPVSGNVELDKYGDGCLATELVLKTPRYVTQDAYGNYFFSDMASYLIRRIDGVTGVVTLVAGGGTQSGVSAGSGTCPSGIGTIKSIEGDGCPGTDAYLGKPAGLAFSPITGNLYFSDSYSYSVHMITAASSCTATNPITQVTSTGACIAPSSTTGTSTGTMTLIAGTPVGDGYYAGDPSTGTNQVAETGTTSTSSYVYKVFGLAFDTSGDLYLEDDYNEAVFALNTSSIPTTVGGITIPAGDITKIVGAQSSTPTCTNGVYPAANGCTYPSSTPSNSTSTGLPAYTIRIDGPLNVALDFAGNIYFDEFYYYDVGKLATGTDIYTPYAGTRGTTTGHTVTARGVATSTVISSPSGLAFDSVNNGNNLYISDGGDGFIWRVDSATQQIYAIAGGSTTAYTAGVTPCAITTTGAVAKDTNGDNCPGRAAKFSNTGGTRFTTAQATTTPVEITGIYVDSYSNLLVADSGNSVIREIASGTSFGRVVGTPTQYLDIHFGVGDTPLGSTVLLPCGTAAAYVVTVGTTVFQAGTPTGGTPNSDNTVDCILPLKVIGTVSGPYTGNLQVTSTAGKISNFPLSVTVVVPVASSTTTTVVGSCPPGGSSTITATVSNTVSQPGGGTVTIYVNGNAVKTATLPGTGTYQTTYTFPVGSTYSVYATYGGDTDDLASTSGSQQTTSFTSQTLVATSGGSTTATVPAGGTALYTVIVSDYTVLTASVPLASITCSALPYGATCVAYPQVPLPSLVAPSAPYCDYGATIALSVTTTQPHPVIYGFGGPVKNKWALLATLPALLLALVVMFRRRKSSLKYSGVLLALIFLLTLAGTIGCGNDFGSASAGTPSGSYPFSVTVVDSSGDTQTLTGFTLNVQ